MFVQNFDLLRIQLGLPVQEGKHFVSRGVSVWYCVIALKLGYCKTVAWRDIDTDTHIGQLCQKLKDIHTRSNKRWRDEGTCLLRGIQTQMEPAKCEVLLRLLMLICTCSVRHIRTRKVFAISTTSDLLPLLLNVEGKSSLASWFRISQIDRHSLVGALLKDWITIVMLAGSRVVGRLW